MAIVFNTLVHAMIEHVNVNYLLKEQSQAFGPGRHFLWKKWCRWFKQILLLYRHLCVTSALAKGYLKFEVIVFIY
jgi:hypothetical protein